MAEASAPIFLLAGGRSMRMQKGPDPLLQEVFRRAGGRRPTVAYVGAASGDRAEFRLWMASLLKEAGAGEVTLAPLCGRRGDAEKAKTAIESANLVFLSGGDVEEGMRVLHEKGMVAFLRRLHRAGKLFFGMSAGSIMLSQHWVRWKDPGDETSSERFDCLGLAPLLCDTHGEEDGWEELQALLALSPNGTIGCGIISGTAIVVETNGTVSALGGEVQRFQKRSRGVTQVESLFPGKSAWP